MPLMLGIPWLASILISAFGALTTFFLRFFVRRIALMLAVLVALTLLTVIFVGGMDAIQDTLITAAETSGLGILLFLPDDFGAIIGAFITAKLAYWVYSWNVKIVQLRMF